MPECRVAIVGAGYTAREHARAFAATPGVDLAGVYSRTRSRAEELARDFGIGLVADSVIDLHAESGAEVVVVCVNELSMNAVAKACLAHPWLPVLEKPPGVDLADALDIHAAAAGRPVLVALNRRAYGVTRAVLEALEAAAGPRFVRVQDQQSMASAVELGNAESVVRNLMYVRSIHLVDYLRVFCRGDVDGVEPIVPWDPQEPRVVAAHVRFSSGDCGLYEAIWHGPGPWAATVTVPGRRWELRPLERGVTQALGGEPEPIVPDPWDCDFKPGFRAQAQAVVRFWSGRPAQVSTLDDAVQTMRLVARIYGHL